jgi:hypothetical protein
VKAAVTLGGAACAVGWLARLPVALTVVGCGLLAVVLLVMLSDRVTYRVALLLAVLRGRTTLPRLPAADSRAAPTGPTPTEGPRPR